MVISKCLCWEMQVQTACGGRLALATICPKDTLRQLVSTKVTTINNQE